MPAIYLVRHGAAGPHLRDYDRLSRLGERQAAATGRALRDRGVREPRVVSGALVRQRESARHLAAAAGWEAGVAVDACWDELDHMHVLERYAPGEDLPALLTERIDVAAERLDEAMWRWWADPGSTWQAFGDRVESALAAVVEAGSGSGSDTVVVTSGGVIAQLCTRLVDGTDGTRFALGRSIANGSVTLLVTGATGTRLVTYNEHAHLVSAGAQLLGPG